MWALFEIAVNFIEAFIVIDFVTKYLKFKHENKKVLKYIFDIILFGGIVTVANNISTNEFLGVALYLLALIVYSFTLLKGKPLSKIFISVFSVIAVMLINSMFIMLWGAVLGVSLEVLLAENFARVTCIIATKLVFFYLTRIVLKIKNKDEVLVKTSDWIILLINPILSMIALSEIMLLAFFHLDEQATFGISSVVICIVVINIITYILYVQTVKNSRALTENKLLKQETEYQKEHLNEVKSLYSEIQTIRHDTKNHLICVLNLLESDNAEHAKQYLNEAVAEVNKTRKFIETDDEIVNCILNEKISKAMDNDIEVSFQIMKEPIGIEQYDATVLLSNLFDNAIEACLESQIKDKQIRISVEEKSGFVVIVMANTAKLDAIKKNPDFMTTKQNKQLHGYGVRSCKKIVEKYNGKIDYIQEENEVICKIIFDKMK